jgi:hypothetical protein
MTNHALSSPHITCAVNRLVPFVHVGDVEASLAFYALLGFVPERIMKDSRGRTFWALARSGKAEIMLAQADGPVDPAQQAVLFYMYSTDVARLRLHLLESGLHDGGAYCGSKGPNDGRRVVFEVAHPHYMRAGEVRVADPDGYCILVGQLE